jgi:hypothetical protein
MVQRRGLLSEGVVNVVKGVLVTALLMDDLKRRYE